MVSKETSMLEMLGIFQEKKMRFAFVIDDSKKINKSGEDQLKSVCLIILINNISLN